MTAMGLDVCPTCSCHGSSGCQNLWHRQAGTEMADQYIDCSDFSAVAKLILRALEFENVSPYDRAQIRIVLERYVKTALQHREVAARVVKLENALRAVRTRAMRECDMAGVKP